MLTVEYAALASMPRTGSPAVHEALLALRQGDVAGADQALQPGLRCVLGLCTVGGRSDKVQPGVQMVFWTVSWVTSGLTTWAFAGKGTREHAMAASVRFMVSLYTAFLIPAAGNITRMGDGQGIRYLRRSDLANVI